ncbi:MAG: malto-oligosyltrehalose trehalohydrolase [Akkermansiaceae bacterium]
MTSTKQVPEVWAPLAKQIELLANEKREPMTRVPEREGWWRGGIPLPEGVRYAFFIDGEGPFPDPRSPSQPEGVHGHSCTVDHGQFDWTDAAWTPPEWSRAVIYELHLGTFSPAGTFTGAIPYLEALVQLGITHLELMPVCEFPGDRGWGYDGTSLYAPHHAYGGVAGLKALINQCHSLGLAVLIDVVYNHLGPDGNYLPKFGPYFSNSHMTPWGEGPNLDGEHSPEVRRFFIENALMWLRDYHADGLRLDAIDKIADDSPKHFLAELKESVGQLEIATGKRRVLIAESASNDPIYVIPIHRGGYGMDAQWNDDFHHALRTAFTHETENYYMDYGRLEDLAKAFRQGFVYDGGYSKFRRKNHGTSPIGLPATTFLAYLQTHDQVGNRAQGDRFHHHHEVSLIHQQIGAALVLLSPYIPMIFMGEEWAASTPFLYFTNHHDETLGKTVSEGRRREFGGSQWAGEVPDPQDRQTFERTKLKWEERNESPHREMLDWYRTLLQLRRTISDFHAGNSSTMEVVADEHKRWLRIRRGRHWIAASLAAVGSTVEIPLASPPAESMLLCAGDHFIKSTSLCFDGPGLVLFRSS